ncbi:hypothetical protein [Streptomyces sp. NBC_01304]|uniref:hypothetical protein n=1 Tax=Streptomyces sp. NBC_01304 TaxID=2903818 RepID=UPI002E0DCFC0|nr:hypothetical protein OG430_44600 [Streptomyces sp. NBC_01304]
MTDPSTLADAAHMVAASAETARPQAQMDGDRWMPVKADTYAELVATVARHERLIAQLCTHAGLDSEPEPPTLRP